jgi:hypothetical protein
VLYGQDSVHNRTGRQNFDTMIWKLVISNRYPRIAKSAYECNAKAFWDFVDKENDLIWKSNNEPTEIDVSINPEIYYVKVQKTLAIVISPVCSSCFFSYS